MIDSFRFNMSANVNEIAAALAKAQAAMKGAIKESINPHFRSKYADLASVWDAAHGPLNANGIAVVQSPSAEGNLVSVTTLLLHSSGQWIGGTITTQARDAGAQAVGGAVTYGRRYGLAAMVGIAPEDDDGETTEGRNQSRAAYTVDAPAAHSAERTPEEIRENAPTQSAGDSGRFHLPPGAVRLLKVDAGANGMKAKAFIQHSGQPGGADGLPLYDAKLAMLAEQCCQDGTPVQLEVVASKTTGKPYIKRLWTIKPEDVTVQSDPVDAEEIPF